MKPTDKDKYLGAPTKATPRRSDPTISVKVIDTVDDSQEVVFREAQAIHLALLQIHFQLDAIEQAELGMRKAVLRAKEAGATWQEIGDARETSAQAAWQRYRPRAAAGAVPDNQEWTVELPFD
jgi:hypothetical protein